MSPTPFGSVAFPGVLMRSLAASQKPADDGLQMSRYGLIG